MISEQILVTNKLGLHARAAAQVVRLASGFKSDIELSNANHCANAKGIMGLMMLAATQGSTLVLKVDGEDEESALLAIREMFNERFGEHE